MSRKHSKIVLGTSVNKQNVTPFFSICAIWKGGAAMKCLAGMLMIGLALTTQQAHAVLITNILDDNGEWTVENAQGGTTTGWITGENGHRNAPPKPPSSIPPAAEDGICSSPLAHGNLPDKGVALSCPEP